MIYAFFQHIKLLTSVVAGVVLFFLLPAPLGHADPRAGELEWRGDPVRGVGVRVDEQL